MTDIIKILLSAIPVFTFLIALIFIDSYKLVKLKSIIQTIIIGAFAAILCFGINNQLMITFGIQKLFYSKYLAPLIEESAKALFFIYLLKSKKIGFMVDSAIFGFAIGAGFAAVENMYYIYALENSNILLWIIRGFGTAVMHGGTTAIFAIVSKSLSDRYASFKIYLFIPGLLSAILIHSFFNHFFISPFISTIAQLLILPALLYFVFHQSEIMLKDWLELGLDVDVFLLDEIKTGNFSQTKIGKYLSSLKDNLPGEVIADLLCYIRIHLELSIRAKGILLLKESGFPVMLDQEIKDKFTELQYLEKSIGKTGKLAISPILHTSTRDLWQLYLLNSK
ncbi:MAG: PrsW family intramembrane metalloprotease [Calditrichia bacterium]|nr:PrsW family intramembrane metalloprotease [Calditrichia bacterium]